MGARTKVSGIGPVIFTALALLFTLATAGLLAMLLAGSEYSKEPVTEVVATSRDIGALSPLTKDDLRMVKVPLSAVPLDAVKKMDDLVSEPPRRAMTALKKGEIVLASRIAAAEAGQGIASFIPKGMRAVVIKSEVATALARTFHPGALVDVLATVRLEGVNRTVTRTILQAVKILAIGHAIDPTYLSKASAANTYAGTDVEESDTVVTLLTTLAQAERLTLASREGRIDLVLRNPDDKKEVATPGVAPAQLFPNEEENADQTSRPSRRRNSRKYAKRGRSGGGRSSPPTIEVR